MILQFVSKLRQEIWICDKVFSIFSSKKKSHVIFLLSLGIYESLSRLTKIQFSSFCNGHANKTVRQTKQLHKRVPKA